MAEIALSVIGVYLVAVSIFIILLCIMSIIIFAISFFMGEGFPNHGSEKTPLR